MKNFLALPNLVDLRHQLPKKQDYPARSKKISTRVWHHSLTLSHLAGSDAAGFTKYHMNTKDGLVTFDKNIFKFNLNPDENKNYILYLWIQEVAKYRLHGYFERKGPNLLLN